MYTVIFSCLLGSVLHMKATDCSTLIVYEILLKSDVRVKKGMICCIETLISLCNVYSVYLSYMYISVSIFSVLEKSHKFGYN